ncbi:hypothetical protein GCM10010211_68060 [Streptomyces albospinus]|uniref:Uncharacterized protein n=1 Tax=Streptomyces albospinus TaxID=285515 RepID=A0ABQ2VJJ9_9ACTN|nr:hypothetical protein GCM10010211_68060 [Streptomyces albospinus]
MTAPTRRRFIPDPLSPRAALRRPAAPCRDPGNVRCRYGDDDEVRRSGQGADGRERGDVRDGVRMRIDRAAEPEPP